MKQQESSFNYRIALIGPPCSGKGTQSQKLSQKYNLPVISPGTLLRNEKSKNTLLAQYLNNQDNWNYSNIFEISFELVGQELSQLDKTKGFILEGVPKDLQSAKRIDSIVLPMRMRIDYVFDFVLEDESVLDNRAKGRLVHTASNRVYHSEFDPPKTAGVDDVTGEPLDKRSDEDAIASRIVAWKSRKTELIPYLKNLGIYKEIDANKSIDEVFQTIVNFLDDQATKEASLKRRQSQRNPPQVEVDTKLPEGDDVIKKIGEPAKATDVAIVIQAIQQVTQSIKKGRFPGMHLTGLYNFNKEPMTKYVYSVSHKVDGTRYFLVILFERAYLVNRKMCVAAIKDIAPLKKYNFYILDGELVFSKDKSTAYFIVFDVISNGTQNIMKKRLEERLDIGRQIVDYLQKLLTEKDAEKPTKLNNSFELLDEVKPVKNKKRKYNLKIQFLDYHPLTSTKNLLTKSAAPVYPTDGLVFVSMGSPYRMGQCKEAFKWKEDEENTIDFSVEVVSKQPPIVRLFVQGSDSLVPFDFSSEPALLEKENKIVECYWDPEYECSIPYIIVRKPTYKEKTEKEENEENKEEKEDNDAVQETKPIEETKKDEAKTQEETKKDEIKPKEETKKDETKPQEETKKDEIKPKEETKKEIKPEETIKNEVPQEEKKERTTEKKTEVEPVDISNIELIKRKGCWRFKREREDKDRPNADWVADAIMKGLEDPLSTEELLKFVSNLKVSRPERGGKSRLVTSRGGTNNGRGGRGTGDKPGRGLDSSGKGRGEGQGKEGSWRGLDGSNKGRGEKTGRGEGSNRGRGDGPSRGRGNANPRGRSDGSSRGRRGQNK